MYESKDDLSNYYNLKESYGPQYRMGRLIAGIVDDNPNFSCELEDRSQRGSVFRYLMGSRVGVANGKNVDVGLVIIDPSIATVPKCKTKTIGLSVPDCYITQDQPVSILEVADFPSTPFDVYGVGARSDGTMVVSIDARYPKTTFLPLLLKEPTDKPISVFTVLSLSTSLQVIVGHGVGLLITV